MESQDYLKVPVELLRAFMQGRVALSSIRHVAGELEIGRTTLHKFLAGTTTPHLRIRRKLALYYLRVEECDAKDDSALVAGLSAASGLLEQLVPAELRDGVRREIAAGLQRLYVTRGVITPTWIAEAAAGLAPGEEHEPERGELA